MEMGSGSLGASGSSDALHGLKFGKKIYFEDVGGGGGVSSRAAPAPAHAPASSSAPPMSALAPSSSGSSGSSASAAKRGKGAAQGGQQQQPPRCQVEGCRVDLTGAKAYYCRHKVCGVHSKSPKVIVAGLEQRFCQQCSRFHQLAEFDQGKRSCRRRLAGHNERRRKPPPGSLPSRYGRLPSSFHDDGNRFSGFLLDFSHPRISSSARDTWPTVRVSDREPTSHWQAGLDSPSGGVAANMNQSYMQGPAGGTLFPSREIPPGERFGVSDSGCALSLLSTQPWGGDSTARSRAPTISENNYEVAPFAQASAAASFASNAWSFKGQSGAAHEYLPEMGPGQAAETGDGRFSGELELALQGNKQCIDPGNGRAYGHGNPMHWSL